MSHSIISSIHPEHCDLLTGQPSPVRSVLWTHTHVIPTQAKCHSVCSGWTRRRSPRPVSGLRYDDFWLLSEADSNRRVSQLDRIGCDSNLPVSQSAEISVGAARAAFSTGQVSAAPCGWLQYCKCKSLFFFFFNSEASCLTLLMLPNSDPAALKKRSLTCMAPPGGDVMFSSCLIVIL